jgi:phosphatidylglycerophosphatase A
MPDSRVDTPPQNPFRLGIAVWLATGGWVGFVPFAPGTFGSLLGIPLAVAVASLPEWWERLGLILLVCACGVRICTVAARRLGGAKDPQMIVLDEIAALPIALLGIPLDLSGAGGFKMLALGFLLFRMFDITKPPPARQAERLPEGLGIMADDWVAAIYANITLRLLLLWNPGSFFTS